MQTFLKQALPLLFTMFFVSGAFAQDEGQKCRSFDLGLELQAYPTGVIPGIRFEKYIDDKASINARLGYQIIDHRDLGVQENEEGSGYGMSLAYRRFFSSCHEGLSLAFRTDLWFNEIDWENDGDSGTTNITVLQPTLMGEYAIKAGENLVFTPSLSFGWEWNVSTDGQPTGEGAILLLGVTMGFGI